MDSDFAGIGNLPDVERLEGELADRIHVLIADLLHRRQRIDAALARLRKAQKALRRTKSKELDRETARPGKTERNYEPRPDSRAGMITQAAADALQAAGRPLNRQQIIQAMEQASIKVDAADLPQLVSKVLWKSELFTNHRGVGYWFSGQPLPHEE